MTPERWQAWERIDGVGVHPSVRMVIELRFSGYYIDEVVRHDDEWLFASRAIRLWDGEILRNFPGKGAWVPRKRPPDLVVKSRFAP